MYPTEMATSNTTNILNIYSDSAGKVKVKLLA